MMRIRRWSIVIAAGIWLASSACALDPSKAISQYVQDYWDSDKGFVGGAVYAICQSGDGYLWIGTERGLVRFDGFAFKLIQRPIPNAPALGAVRGLVSDAEGNLWIRPDGARLLLYRDGHFEDAVARYGLLEETAFTAMSVDSRGNLLLWGIKNRTLRFQAGQFKSLPESAGLPGIVISLAAGSDGRLWMGTRDIGLFSTDQGHLIDLAPAKRSP
jgi:ligand-binding sensor domain-containing protein